MVNNKLVGGQVYYFSLIDPIYVTNDNLRDWH